MQISDKPLTEAYEIAKRESEPIFVPVGVYADDRGWSIMNQFQGVMSGEGQINYSVMYPQVIKAWHRHRVQTDFWLCLNGHLKIGINDEKSGRTWSIVVGEKRPGVLIIPPTFWHGAATVGPDPAGLLYYVTHTYNAAQPDEERCEYDSIAGFNWGVEFK